jgi:hypothetical protein
MYCGGGHLEFSIGTQRFLLRYEIQNGGYGMT